MVYKVDELQVYQRAYKAALEMHKFSLELPRIEQYAMASQLRRASKGRCANIVEGFAKQHRSPAEFKRFLLMAIGSSEEMRLWLQFCGDLEYMDDNNCKNWKSEYDEISKMLNGLIENWQT